MMHWGSPWIKGASKGEWRHSPGAQISAPGDLCRASSDSGQTFLPMKESLRTCWNQEHCSTWQAGRALQLCQLCQLCQGELVSRGRNPCPLSALCPPQLMHTLPADQVLALSQMSPAEFGHFSSWVYLHDPRPTETDVVHQGGKRNVQK